MRVAFLGAGGNPFWYSRELFTVLEYTQWRNFAKVIDKVRITCKNSGYDIIDHFAHVGKMVEAGATSKLVTSCCVFLFL